MKMVNIGTNMCISSDEVESIMDPKSIMVKRMIDAYRDRNRVFDATRGKKTLSVIFTKRGNAYLTVYKVDTLKERFNKVSEPFAQDPAKNDSEPQPVQQQQQKNQNQNRKWNETRTYQPYNNGNRRNN